MFHPNMQKHSYISHLHRSSSLLALLNWPQFNLILLSSLRHDKNWNSYFHRAGCNQIFVSGLSVVSSELICIWNDNHTVHNAFHRIYWNIQAIQQIENIFMRTTNIAPQWTLTSNLLWLHTFHHFPYKKHFLGLIHFSLNLRPSLCCYRHVVDWKSLESCISSRTARKENRKFMMDKPGLHWQLNIS